MYWHYNNNNNNQNNKNTNNNNNNNNNNNKPILNTQLQRDLGLVALCGYLL